MKFHLAVLALFATAEATKTKSQQQMLAEIEAMSLNANMHQVSLREKTLIKSYLEVDMNEFFQQKMDSELFEGVSEQEKAQFVGYFFHWAKCRFSDCNLLQTKAKLNTHVKSDAHEPPKEHEHPAPTALAQTTQKAKEPTKEETEKQLNE